MNAASFVFFGLLFIPLIIFIVWLVIKDKSWLIKGDKYRNYLGLLVLAVMIVITLITILRYDTKFMDSGEGATLKIQKSQMPSYR